MSLPQSERVIRAFRRARYTTPGREFFTWVAVWIIAMLFWALVLFGIATAQSSTTDEDQLTLGQAMVGEADFSAPVDHAALGYVLKRRWLAAACCDSFADYIRRYVSIFKSHVKSPRANWVRELDLEAVEPASWPKNLSWDAYRPKWLAVLDRAQGVINGTLRDPCRRADQWGSRVLAADVIRAERALKSGRWILARCAGETANRFYNEVR